MKPHEPASDGDDNEIDGNANGLEGLDGGETGVDDDDDDGYVSGEYESQAEDMHEDMHEDMNGLLKELGMFRKKLGVDRERFRDEMSARKPLGIRTNM